MTEKERSKRRAMDVHKYEEIERERENSGKERAEQRKEEKAREVETKIKN